MTIVQILSITDTITVTPYQSYARPEKPVSDKWSNDVGLRADGITRTEPFISFRDKNICGIHMGLISVNEYPKVGYLLDFRGKKHDGTNNGWKRNTQNVMYK